MTEMWWLFRSSNEAGSTLSLFHTRDLLGCTYVGVVIPVAKQLWLIRCSVDAKSLLVAMETVSGVQAAVSLFSVSMMLVLDCAGQLAMYSGPVKVSQVLVLVSS